ncbi:MAG TPA: class I SAM-dependent methyltransferase [Bacteroidia bacterium]|nr:class I SAM-dependent methyltransferase [Bacteroidia bacterium]
MLDLPRNIRAAVKESRLERNSGYCCICRQETEFIIYNEWLRDNYRCKRCQSIPRNRALVNVLDLYCKDWPNLDIHESSPGGCVSELLKKNCRNYTSSHYYDDVPRGEYRNGHRSEDLSRMTFPDASFDLLITSDVFEHVFEPDKAFREVARVLRPGGMHIFTMPWVPAHKKSVQRARLRSDGSIEYFREEIYHGNPIGKGKGALVTFDWGLDFTDFIFEHGGMTTTIYLETDRKKGLDGQFLEVFISRKPQEK